MSDINGEDGLIASVGLLARYHASDQQDHGGLGGMWHACTRRNAATGLKPVVKRQGGCQ